LIDYLRYIFAADIDITDTPPFRQITPASQRCRQATPPFISHCDIDLDEAAIDYPHYATLMPPLASFQPLGHCHYALLSAIIHYHLY
jgi:hypothetical protein